MRSEISCSRWLAFYGKAQNVAKDAQKGFVAGVFMLKGHQKLKRVWRVKCEKRGVFAIENVTLAVSDLFGLCKPSCMREISAKICVLPSPCDMQLPMLSSDKFIGDNTVRRFILPDPFVISGAKPYTGREPMNRIHWSETARTGELMAYNNEFTTERKMLLVFNLQRIEADETVRLAVSVLEAQIKAAAFMLDYCYRSHIAVAFAANNMDSIFVAADEGYQHTLNILRTLATLKNACGTHINDYLPRLDFSEYTDVIFITEFVSEALSEVIGGLLRQGKNAAVLSNGLTETGFCEVCHIPRTRSYPVESGEDE